MQRAQQTQRTVMRDLVLLYKQKKVQCGCNIGAKREVEEMRLEICSSDQAGPWGSQKGAGMSV